MRLSHELMKKTTRGTSILQRQSSCLIQTELWFQCWTQSRRTSILWSRKHDHCCLNLIIQRPCSKSHIVNRVIAPLETLQAIHFMYLLLPSISLPLLPPYLTHTSVGDQVLLCYSIRLSSIDSRVSINASHCLKSAIIVPTSGLLPCPSELRC